MDELLPDAIRRQYLGKFAFTVLLVVLATGVVGLVFQQQVTSELTHDIHSEMETVSTLEAEEIRQWVNTREQETRMLSNYQVMQTGDQQAIREILTDELETLGGETQAIHYVDLGSGEILMSTERATVGSTLGDRKLKWAHGSLAFEQTDVAVSEGYEHDGRELVAFVSPVEGTNNAVVMTTDVTVLAERFSDPIEGGYTQVVNNEGTIEIAEDQTQALTQYRNGTASTALQAGLEGKHGVIERDETGEVVAYAPVEGTDWVLLAHAPQSNAYALRGEVTQDFIILIGVSLFGFALIGVTIGRSTVSALTDIRDRATAIAEGDTGVDVANTDRIDEVGQALDAFDETVEYLQAVTSQANALADQEFDAAAFDQDVPGDIGAAIQQMKADLEEFITDLERAKSDADRARGQAQELAATLEQKAAEFGDVMEQAADGDLTKRLDEDVDNDAMEEIAVAFNEMLADLEETLVTIQDFSEESAAVSEEVTASAEQVTKASEDVSTSIQEIADGSSRQNENLQQASSELANMSATIEEIASSADEVADVTSEAAGLGERGRESASETVTEMDAIEETAEQAIGEVERLESEMGEINEVVELIHSIAEQTNILALNASIEAAQAGTAGEGFAVVAEEVKTLAEETREATREIEARIDSVQSATTETVSDMQEMGERVSDGMETVDEAITVLEEIVEKVENANTGVQSINEATDEQATSSEEIVSMVEEVGAISEEAAAQAQSVSASAEEQTASIAEVTAGMEDLSEQSQKLNELLGEFQVRDDSVGGHTTETRDVAPQDDTDEKVATDD